MRLKDYGRYRKKRKEYIYQSGLLLTGVMGDVRAELALVMHILHERPAFRTSRIFEFEFTKSVPLSKREATL